MAGGWYWREKIPGSLPRMLAIIIRLWCTSLRALSSSCPMLLPAPFVLLLHFCATIQFMCVIGGAKWRRWRRMRTSALLLPGKLAE